MAEKAVDDHLDVDVDVAVYEVVAVGEVVGYVFGLGHNLIWFIYD